MCDIDFSKSFTTVSCKISGKPMVILDYAGMFCEDCCDYNEKHEMFGIGYPGEAPDNAIGEEPS